MASPVAVAACDGYAPEFLEPALDAVLDAVGGLGRIVRPEQTVLLKPNLIAGLPPERGGTTHPAVLDSLCRRIRELGARPMIGDAPAWGGPRQVAEATGIAAVCVKYGEEFVYFDRHTRLDSRCPEVASHFHVDPRVLQADVVINVPKLKSHMQLGFTGAMKNLYGCLAGREKALHHCTESRSDLVFARYLVAYQASLPVALHIVDGIQSMEGTGPRLGTPRHLGVLLASHSACEVDAVGAAILGLPASHRLLLDAAAELGLGETDVDRIPVVGPPLDTLRQTDWRHPELLGVFFSPLRLVRGWWRNRRLVRAEAVG